MTVLAQSILTVGVAFVLLGILIPWSTKSQDAKSIGRTMAMGGIGMTIGVLIAQLPVPIA